MEKKSRSKHQNVGQRVLIASLSRVSFDLGNHGPCLDESPEAYQCRSLVNQDVRQSEARSGITDDPFCLTRCRKRVRVVPLETQRDRVCVPERGANGWVRHIGHNRLRWMSVGYCLVQTAESDCDHETAACEADDRVAVVWCDVRELLKSLQRLVVLEFGKRVEL